MSVVIYFTYSSCTWQGVVQGSFIISAGLHETGLRELQKTRRSWKVGGLMTLSSVLLLCYLFCEIFFLLSLCMMFLKTKLTILSVLSAFFPLWWIRVQGTPWRDIRKRCVNGIKEYQNSVRFIKEKRSEITYMWCSNI